MTWQTLLCFLFKFPTLKVVFVTFSNTTYKLRAQVLYILEYDCFGLASTFAICGSSWLVNQMPGLLSWKPKAVEPNSSRTDTKTATEGRLRNPILTPGLNNVLPQSRLSICICTQLCAYLCIHIHTYINIILYINIYISIYIYRAKWQEREWEPLLVWALTLVVKATGNVNQLVRRKLAQAATAPMANAGSINSLNNSRCLGQTDFSSQITA